MNYDEELLDRKKGIGRYSDNSVEFIEKLLIYMGKQGFESVNYLDK